MKKLLVFFGFSFFTLGFIIFLLFAKTSSAPIETGGYPLPRAQKKSPLPLHYSYFADKDIYEKFFANTVPNTPEERTVSGVILPHHLVVADRIAAMYERLKKQKVKTVILVGPNHFNTGFGKIISSRAEWETPYGKLKSNAELIETLSREGLVSIEENPFAQEHAITAHIAFIKRTWPDAQIVPLILKWGTTREEMESLARSLKEKNILVIASVDFSHHQPWWVADFHDELSLNVIESFDQKRIYDLEIDSPASIAFLLEYLTVRNARAAVRVDRTNALRITKDLENSENTTHLFEYFVDGEPAQEPVVTLVLLPDIMLGRDVAAQGQKNNAPNYPFEKIQGTEGLFFRGFDLLVANLEGPVTMGRAQNQKSISFAFDPGVAQTLKKYRFNALSLANNHGYDQGSLGFEDTKRFLSAAGMHTFGNPIRENETESVLTQEIAGKRIALVGFNLTDHKIQNTKLTEIISATKNQSDFVIAFPHWGAEYQRFPTAAQKTWAHLFIDSGADAVIGHHPHVVETVEIYKNRPVFYSLGNFIFDQYFSKETQEGLGIGVVVKNTEARYYLIPYTIPKSQPTLMMHSARQQFLTALARDSKLDKDATAAVQSGIITLKLEP